MSTTATATVTEDAVPSVHAERIIRVEARMETLASDVSRLATSHERTENNMRIANERTEAALRGVADRINESMVRANDALVGQANAFVTRIDALGGQFTAKISEIMVSEREQDKSISAKLEGLDAKFATKDDVGLVKTIILACAGFLAAWAFHKLMGGAG